MKIVTRISFGLAKQLLYIMDTDGHVIHTVAATVKQMPDEMINLCKSFGLVNEIIIIGNAKFTTKIKTELQNKNITKYNKNMKITLEEGGSK